MLEEGKFQLAFFDDRLAMPDIYGGNPAEVVANGVRVVKMDPVATLLAMGFGTKYMGIGSTASTTYYEPFDVARRFQTVDHMIGGRAAWNVVTSVNDGEAHNMGREMHLRARPALRPRRRVHGDRAVLLGRLGRRRRWSWTRRPACSPHPDKVHRLEYEGKFLNSHGTFTVPRSPQGHPVIIQAGASDRGKTFAARWAETVFVGYPDLEEGKRQYADFKAAVARAGARSGPGDRQHHCLSRWSRKPAPRPRTRWRSINSLYREVDGLVAAVGSA